MTLLAVIYAAALVWLFRAAIRQADGADKPRNDPALKSLAEYRARAQRRRDA